VEEALPRRRYDDGVTFFPGFERRAIATDGASIHTVWGGSGPPLLLLHGSPQTHVMWHKVAPRLAESFTVVMTDLRGYGDSSKPPGRGTHADYSKRAMANDQVQVMRALGFDRFAVAGHDRGARVTWRLAVEHPEVVTRAAVLDIVPLPYSLLSNAFATEYFHWYFLIQPEPLPETLIEGSAEFWVSGRCRERDGITPAALAEYVRCYTPHAIHGNCEDYRAGATIDLEHAAADGDRVVECPLLVLWGQDSTVGRLYDVMGVWRRHGRDVRGHALQGRHFIAEESPDDTYEALRVFFSAG
jgi:haloacetate dehalogenase